MSADYCLRPVYPANMFDPPLFCDEPTVEGADYCECHLEEE